MKGKEEEEDKEKEEEEDKGEKEQMKRKEEKEEKEKGKEEKKEEKGKEEEKKRRKWKGPSELHTTSPAIVFHPPPVTSVISLSFVMQLSFVIVPPSTILFVFCHVIDSLPSVNRISSFRHLPLLLFIIMMEDGELTKYDRVSSFRHLPS